MNKTPNTNKSGRLCAAVSAGLLLASGINPVGAAVLTWDGGASPDVNWSNPVNWVGDTAAPVAGDELVFAGSVGLVNNNDLAVNTWFHSITFASDAGAFLLQGNQITIGNNTTTHGVTNNSANVQTIDIETKNNRTVRYDTAGASMVFTKRLWDWNYLKTGTNDLILRQTLSGFNGNCQGLNAGRIIANPIVGGPWGHGMTINSNATLVTVGPAQAFNTDYRANVVMFGGLWQVQNTNALGAAAFERNSMLRSTNFTAVVENGSAVGPVQLLIGEGSAARVGAFDGILRDGTGGGTLGVILTNSSTYSFWRLGGTNSYTGSTLVLNGNANATRLLINGEHTGGGSYVVNGNVSGGKAYLGGAGSIVASAVNVGVNGVISPGGDLQGTAIYSNQGGGSANTGTFAETNATFTINGNVTLADASSALDIHLGGTTAGTYDKLVIAGAGKFTNNNASLLLTIDLGYEPAAGDKFTLVQVPGTSAADNVGVFATLNGVALNLAQGATNYVGASVFRISYRADGTTFDAGPGNGNDIMIEFLQDTATRLTWLGDVSDVWDVAGIANWRDTNNVAANFANLDKVTFNDGSTVTNISLSGDLNPSTIVVDSTKNYTFAGTGKLTGAILITKTNTGTLTLLTANDSLGSATINQGTIQLGAGGADGTLTCPVIVNSNGTFAVNRSDDVALGTVSGKGVLVHSGAGKLIVTNNLSGFTGTASNLTGIFQLGDGTAAGNAGKIGGTVIVATGTELYHNYNGNGDITVANSMRGNGNATFDFSSGGARTVNFAATATNSGFTGTTTVKSFVRLNVASVAAAPAGPIIVEGSSTPAFGSYYSHPGATVTNFNSITIAGQGPASPVDSPRGKGALRLGNVWAGPVILSADATIGGDGTGTILGNISGSFTLEYLGGTIAVGPTTGANTYGATRINEDYNGNFLSPTLTTVRALNASAFSASPVTMIGRARLELNGNNLSLANLLDESTTAGGTNYAPVVANNSGTTAATLTVGSDGNSGTFVGTFINGSSRPLNLTKVGAGTMTLSGDSTTTGTVSVEGGTLALAAASGSYVTGDPVLGTGSFSNATAFAVGTGATLDVSGRTDGTLMLNAGQTLKHAGAGTGPITVTGNVNLGTGALQLAINRSGFVSDSLAASGTVTYSGTLAVTNIGAVLQAGDSFQLFPGGVSGFTAYALPTVDVANNVQYTWNNTVAADGKITVATVSPLVNTVPGNILSSVSGNTLTLAWPTNAGWSLQTQTNVLSVGISNNWATIPGSETVTNMNITIDPANPSVFYRLFYVIP